MNLWQISEQTFDPTPIKLHSQESVYTIGNGYFCTRGTFEEGYPQASPATLLFGVFDEVPIAREELANAPDWTPIQLFVNGERFRLDKGHLLDYQRTLDLAHGLLSRTVRWESATGARLRISIERFASLADEHVGLIRYRVTAERASKDLSLALLVSLNTAVGNYQVMHWETTDQGHQDGIMWLTSETRHSGISLAQTMSLTSTTSGFSIAFNDMDFAPNISLHTKLVPGATLVADKMVVMYTSRDGVEPLSTALHHHQQLISTGYDTLLAQHQEAWRRFWQGSDILVEGDEKAQQGIRYNLYQLRINASLHDDRYSIAAKGLTGSGYRGHIFHDTEIFMLPFFLYTMPTVARNLVMYRYHTLPGARRKAHTNGYQGAEYAWESTLSGDETTPPVIVHPETGNIIAILNAQHEIHISASVAYAAWLYWRVTEDDAFMRDYGAEIVLSTALFWGSRVEKNSERDEYELDDVIGPDEWHEHVNNNAYTNAMARWNLQTALGLLPWLQQYAPDKARALEQQLDLTAQRLDYWRDVIERMCIPQEQQSGLIEQFDGFFKLQALDQERYRGRTDSYQGIFGVQETQKYRIIKQADVLMLLTVLNEEFDCKTKQVNWDYYYPITDHDYGSSLTPAYHVILACELGKLKEAYELFMKGTLDDLENLRGNTPDGIHTACCGAVWQAVVFGFAGVRVSEDGYSTAPHLPAAWTRLAFSFLHKGKREQIDLRR